MEEKRHSRRMDLDVHIKIKTIEKDGNNKNYDVDVVNLSKGGMAFTCQQSLAIGGFYDVQIVTWMKEKIDTVIKVIRLNDGVYGGTFVGLPPSDAMKIEIYEMFNFPGEKQ